MGDWWVSDLGRDDLQRTEPIFRVVQAFNNPTGLPSGLTDLHGWGNPTRKATPFFIEYTPYHNGPSQKICMHTTL